jgi:hypothetical protein
MQQHKPSSSTTTSRNNITHASTSCNVTRKKNVELLESFNKVNCAERCKDVVLKAAHAANMPDTTTTEISCAPLSSSSKSQSSSMMYRRSQRIRWETLRNVSRTIVKCRREVDSICDKSHDLSVTKIEKTQQICRDELQKMYSAEMASVPKPNTHGREAQRAETRRNRLVHLADGMLNQMSASNDSSGECDGVSSDDEEME